MVKRGKEAKRERREREKEEKRREKEENVKEVIRKFVQTSQVEKLNLNKYLLPLLPFPEC